MNSALAPLSQILPQPRNLPIFDSFELVAKEFARYVSDVEKISCNAINSPETFDLRSKFESMDPTKQAAKLTGFKTYYNHCEHMVSNGISLRDKVTTFKSFLRTHSLILPDEKNIFSLIDNECLIEIYNLDFMQSYRSVDFLDKVSHSILALEACEWWELFERSSIIVNEQMKIVQGIYSGEITNPLYKPVGIHTVKEINVVNPMAGKTEVLLYSPVFRETGEFEGGLQIFKIKELRSLDFKIVSSQPELI